MKEVKSGGIPFDCAVPGGSDVGQIGDIDDFVAIAGQGTEKDIELVCE